MALCDPAPLAVKRWRPQSDQEISFMRRRPLENPKLPNRRTSSDTTDAQSLTQPPELGSFRNPPGTSAASCLIRFRPCLSVALCLSRILQSNWVRFAKLPEPKFPPPKLGSFRNPLLDPIRVHGCSFVALFGFVLSTGFSGPAATRLPRATSILYIHVCPKSKTERGQPAHAKMKMHLYDR